MEKAIYQVEWRCTVSMEKVKLKDICRLINGRAYKQEELLDSGKYPVLRVGNFFSDKVFYYSDLELEEDKYCDNGDLLFAWSASFGPKIWDGEKVIYHYHIWKMELTDRVNKEFLFYYLFHLSERIKSEGHGGIMIHTTKAEMEEREFNLPTLEEQIAISEILNKVMSVIDKRKEELSVLDDLIKARFVEMFGDPVSNPLGWEKKMLKTVCVKLNDGTHFSPESFEEGEYKYVTAKNIKESGFDFTNITYVSEAVHRPIYERCNPELGDVLYIKDGVTTGIAMVNTLNEEFTLLSSVALLKQNRKIMDGYFLAAVLNNENMYSDIRSNMGGAAITRLTIAKLNMIQIIVPPLKLQQQFADFVHQVDKSKVAVQKALEQTQTLFDSLMQKYFG